MMRNARHVLGYFLLYHLPPGNHHDDRQESGKNDQRHGYSVDTQVIVNAERGYPLTVFDKLHRRRAGIKCRIQRQTQQEYSHRQRQAGLPDQRRPLVIPQGKHRAPPEDRQPDQRTQNVEIQCIHAVLKYQLIRIKSPIIMTNA
jgi:hypothetical protein